MSFCFQSFEDSTPKKAREESIRSHKETLQQQQADAEQKLQKQHKDFLELEIRKFRRRKMLQLHNLESNLLREVRLHFIYYSRLTIRLFQLT